MDLGLVIGALFLYSLLHVLDEGPEGLRSLENRGRDDRPNEW
jgi:hypothetical protein